MIAHIFNWRIWLYGFLTWLVPFVVSVFFYDRTGALTISLPMFKSLMVVIGGGVGAGFLVLTFRHVRASVASGFAVGLAWFAINIALDLVVLVPMMRVSMTTYLFDIGLRYLLLPIFAVAMGSATARDRS